MDPFGTCRVKVAHAQPHPPIFAPDPRHPLRNAAGAGAGGTRPGGAAANRPGGGSTDDGRPAAPGAPEAPATEPSAAGTGDAVQAKPPPVYPSPDEVNAAVFTPGMQIAPDQPSALMLKLQVLLDRVGISPGVIDGYAGRNLSKAIQLAEVILGMQPDGILDADLWQALSTSAQAESPVLVGYAITPGGRRRAVLSGPAQRLRRTREAAGSGYRTPLEMFAERFHMNERLLTRSIRASISASRARRSWLPPSVRQRRRRRWPR